MQESAADQAAFLADFGKPVVWGEVNTTGILDSPGALALSDQIVNTDFALRYRTAALPGLDTDDEITVDGVEYIVRHSLPIGDGAFSIAALRTPDDA